MKQTKLFLAAGALAVASLAACRSAPEVASPSSSASGSTASWSVRPAPSTLDEIGTAYAKLVLAVGEHDPDYVDAFYGPVAWREEAKQRALTLAQIEADAAVLLASVDTVPATLPRANVARVELRREYLKTQLAALKVRAEMLGGRKLSFDEEARLLYDTEAPHYTEAQFEPGLKRIAALLPKAGKHDASTLSERYNRYLDRFTVPQDRIEPVMQTAIAEARARTYAHIPLPIGEFFELSLVSGKPWSAYNWYQGKYLSRIEVNTELPIPISRIIDLAAHEGYPGHHAYNSLLEVGLVSDLDWPEYQAYALFSPQSLIAEGSADYGVGLAFPGADKLAFLKTLFKAAGLDVKQAATYLKVVTAARELAPAGIEAARRYLDGAASADQTAAWLEKYTLASPERAKQRLAFFDKYRAYVINYSWGETLIKRYVEREGDKKLGSKKQWQVFFELLSTPRTPGGLLASAAVTKADVNDVADFTRFMATRPTAEQFQARYPQVLLVLPGSFASREFRANRSRYFAQLDATGRIEGGHFS
jgi:hypothetical protein